MAVTAIITFGLFFYIKIQLKSHNDEIEMLQKRISALEHESSGIWC